MSFLDSYRKAAGKSTNREKMGVYLPELQIITTILSVTNFQYTDRSHNF